MRVFPMFNKVSRGCETRCGCDRGQLSSPPPDIGRIGESEAAKSLFSSRKKPTSASGFHHAKQTAVKVWRAASVSSLSPGEWKGEIEMTKCFQRIRDRCSHIAQFEHGFREQTHSARQEGKKHHRPPFTLILVHPVGKELHISLARDEIGKRVAPLGPWRGACLEMWTKQPLCRAGGAEAKVSFSANMGPPCDPVCGEKVRAFVGT